MVIRKLTRGASSTEKNTASENASSAMARSTLAIGKMARCMVKVRWNMSLSSMCVKVAGSRTDSMVSKQSLSNQAKYANNSG